MPSTALAAREREGRDVGGVFQEWYCFVQSKCLF